MKKYFVLATTALVAMCACTKVNVNEAPEIDQKITFQAAPYSAATKSDAEPGTPLFLATGNNDFGVYAYYNVERGFASINNVYMNGVKVSHGDKTTNDDWAPTTDYYWPKTGYLTFVAWAPFAQTASYDQNNGITWTNWAITPAPGTDLGSGNKIDLLYTVVDDATKDLQATPSQSMYGHKGVPMLFHHALAKLNFQVEYDMTNLTDAQKAMFTVKVNEITLKTLGNKASFAGGVWGTPAASADQKLAEASNELTSASATQTDYVEDYFIIPQTPVQLVVKYEINGIACPDATLNLATTNITDWVENHVYTYNLKISPVTEKITFDPSVAKWDVVTPEPIKIPADTL